MVNKKAVLIATIIVIIIVGLIVGLEIKKIGINEKYLEEKAKNETEASYTNTETNEATNEVTKKETEDIDKNETSNSIDSTEKNEVDDNTTNTSTDSNSSDKTSENNSPEDIAIDLVEKKIGNKNSDSEVYFYVEDEIQKGVFIISVRDGETTTEIGSYKVDINTKTVTKN